MWRLTGAIGIDNLCLSNMPKTEMPSGALVLLILRVLRSGPLHGYAIAQRIHVLSSEVLRVEEGSLYPALQRILLKGWVKSEWGTPRPTARSASTAHSRRPEATRGRALRLRPREQGHPVRLEDRVVESPHDRAVASLRYLLNRRRFDPELTEELEFHREMAARDGGRGWATRSAARGCAGRVGLDVDRPARSGPALRGAQLWRSPGFTLAAVVMLAIGIGAKIAAFGFFNLVVLRPLPVRDPDTLLRFERRARQSATDLPYPEMAFSARTRDAVGGAGLTSTRLPRGGGRSRQRALRHGEFLRGTGRPAALGRGSTNAATTRRRRAGRGAGVRVLAAPVRCRPVRGRHDPPERQAGHGRRRGAAEIQRPERNQPGLWAPLAPAAVFRPRQPAAHGLLGPTAPGQDVGPHAARRTPPWPRRNWRACRRRCDRASQRHLGRRDPD